MLKWLLKTLRSLGVALILIFILVYIMMFFFVPAEKMVRQFARQMENSTGTKIEIGKVQYFPLTLLLLRDLNITGKQGGEPISIDRARLRIGLIPLIRERAELTLDLDAFNGKIRLKMKQAMFDQDTPAQFSTLADNLDLAQIPDLQDKVLAGTLSLKSEMEIKGVWYESMTGEAELHIRDATISGSMLAMLPGAPKQIPQTELDARARVVSGMMFLDAVDLRSPVLNANVTGSISLMPTPEECKLDLDLQLLP